MNITKNSGSVGSMARINLHSLVAQHPHLKSQLISGGVIATLLLLSVAVGALAASGREVIALAVLALPVVFFGMLLLVHKFELMVVLLPIMALAVPLDIPTGTFTRLPISLILSIALCGIWIVSMIMRRQFAIAPTILNRPFLAFGLVCSISFVWGIIWRDPILRMYLFNNFILVQVASLLTYLASMGAALLVGNFVQTPGRLKFMLWSFIICGAMMTLTQFFRIPQPFLNDRGLWGLWTAMPAFCLALMLPGVRWYIRAGLLAFVALNLYQTVIVNSLWISGWLPTVMGIGVAIVLWSWKAVVASGILMLPALPAIYEYVNRVANDNVSEGGLERLGIWELSWSVVSQHWLFGTGPAGYAPYNMTYFPFDARSTHNNYLDVLGQFGFMGMLTWLIVGAVGVYEGIRLRRLLPPGFLRTVVIIATAGWVAAQGAMFFGDWVLPFAYNQTVTGFKYTVYTWIYLGMLISVRQMVARQAAAAHPAASTVESS